MQEYFRTVTFNRHKLQFFSVYMMCVAFSNRSCCPSLHCNFDVSSMPTYPPLDISSMGKEFLSESIEIIDVFLSFIGPPLSEYRKVGLLNVESLEIVIPLFVVANEQSSKSTCPVP